jgi:hypothetical protein
MDKNSRVLTGKNLHFIEGRGKLRRDVVRPLCWIPFALKEQCEQILTPEICISTLAQRCLVILAGF